MQPQPKENIMRRTNPIRVPKPIAPTHALQTPKLVAARRQTSAPGAPMPDWKTRMKERVARIAAAPPKADLWREL
jgi:hypothetical protein